MKNNAEYLQRVTEDPSCIRQVMGLIAQEKDLDDALIDLILGLPHFKYGIEPRSQESEQDFRNRYGFERFMYLATPYFVIRDILQATNPQSGDIYYDLGSGFGKFPLFGALTREAYFKGVEIIPERNICALQTKQRYNIENVDLISANVLDVDFSDGTMFYMYQPFEEPTAVKVYEKLAQIARSRKIVVALTLPDNVNPGYSWLKKVNQIPPSVQIYESV